MADAQTPNDEPGRAARRGGGQAEEPEAGEQREPDRSGSVGEPFRGPEETGSGSLLDEANEADVAEQQQALDGTGSVTDPDVDPSQANEGDVLEQGRRISDDDDEEEERGDREVSPGTPRPPW